MRRMMARWHLCFVLIFCNGALASALWTKDHRFDDSLPSPSALSVDHSETVHVKGQCALLANSDHGFQGFFYNEDTKNCTLTSSVYLTNTPLTSSPGFRYYRSTPFACPLDYVLHEQSGTCFKLHKVPTTWTMARDACSAVNGRLAVLDTQEKEDFFLDYLDSAPPGTNGWGFYLGAHRPSDKWNKAWTTPGVHDLEWLSGQPVALPPSHWGDGEPQNMNTNENVLVIFRNGEHVWGFGDSRVDAPYYFVCEFALF
ncbi:uncharacterized protein [Littorina saxatilis]|uniref:uncharacterized protein n=1 Tax=Littorina saxatilis TaxID=31220 RepID=UPI0038B52A74